ncbi:MAG: metallophosphatase domain-containing protein [Saprospiraceae bacterium]|nr:metallophosphatase domain-containing protein [Saprospiraceae bacterium]
MKIICISDTHGLHEQLALPEGDIIIHAGDITDHGSQTEVVAFLDWFSDLDYAHKIFIGGNHDIFLDEYPVEVLELLPANVTYLRNNEYEVNGINIWGSPVSPDLIYWAFGKRRSEMADHWRFMPGEVDILITHTPPFGILDQSSSYDHLGCEALLECVKEIKPRLHIFGHIHASYGSREEEETTYINASNLDSYQGLINPPIIVHY